MNGGKIKTRGGRFIFLSATARRFRGSHARIQVEVKNALIETIGENEFSEDDAWAILSRFRMFAHWGGAGFDEKWPRESVVDDEHCKPEPPPTRLSKGDLRKTANALQKAYEAVKMLCADAGAVSVVESAKFEQLPDKGKVYPFTHGHPLEVLRGIDTLGKAVQQVIDDNLLRQNGWRDVDKMRRAIVRDTAIIYNGRAKKAPYSEGDLMVLIEDVFKALNMSEPGPETILDELRIY